MKLIKTIFCTALLCVAAAASAKTENVTIQGSVGKLSAYLTTPDNLAEGAGTRFVPAEGYDVTSVESETNGKTITTYTVAKTAAVTE